MVIKVKKGPGRMDRKENRIRSTEERLKKLWDKNKIDVRMKESDRYKRQAKKISHKCNWKNNRTQY